MESVRLWPIDIELSDSGENFDPSKLDHVNGEDREKTRECVESFEKSGRSFQSEFGQECKLFAH